jgi:predicted metal-dependent enzyme (double-stranded beta helix superfamily)
MYNIGKGLSGTSHTHMHHSMMLYKKAYSPRIHRLIYESREIFGKKQIDLKLIPRLVEKLSTLQLNDVNERLDSLGYGEVAYVSIVDEEMFTIGMFLLAPGAVIPLHNHPKMIVLTQVVYGSLKCTSFDYCENLPPYAKMVSNGNVYQAPSTHVLFPESGGNMHTFSSENGCIFIDVMSPPYAEEDEREITYFQATPTKDSQLYLMTPIQFDFELLDLS